MKVPVPWSILLRAKMKKIPNKEWREEKKSRNPQEASLNLQVELLTSTSKELFKIAETQNASSIKTQKYMCKYRCPKPYKVKPSQE